MSDAGPSPAAPPPAIAPLPPPPGAPRWWLRGLVVLGSDVGGANDGVFKPGDVIEAMAFQPISSMSAARAIATRANVGERPFVVQILRDGVVSYRRMVARS